MTDSGSGFLGAGDSLSVSGWILPSLPSLDQPSQPGLQHLGVEHLPCGGLVGGEEVRAPGGLGLGRREGAQVVEEWRQPANSDGSARMVVRGEGWRKENICR